MNAATPSSSWAGSAGSATFSRAPEADASDGDLLRSYVFEKNGDAFTKLVQRHWSLVYGVAYRGTGNTALAQDITQAVFILLDRKCADFAKETVLAGWLFRTAMFTTKNALKAEVRRKEREQRVLPDSADEEPNAEQAWTAISGHLDEGLANLSIRDRDVIILRFLQDRSFKEVGVTLGLNEHGARQQALRALDRLRKFFRRRGIFYPIALLALAFGARPTLSEGIQSLPSKAAESLAAAILAHARRRRVQMTLLAGSLILAAVVGLAILKIPGDARTDSIARRQTIEAVDRALWLGDSAGFAALISFGPVDPIRAQKVLYDYCVAYHEMRRSFVARFGQPGETVPGWIDSLRGLSWLARDRLREQPTVNGEKRAINRIVPGYSMHLIRESAGWKWNLFDHAPPAEVKKSLGEIEGKTAVLDDLRLKMESFVRADDLRQAIEAKFSAGRIELR